jgi:hypothetical protein
VPASNAVADGHRRARGDRRLQENRRRTGVQKAHTDTVREEENSSCDKVRPGYVYGDELVPDGELEEEYADSPSRSSLIINGKRVRHPSRKQGAEELNEDDAAALAADDEKEYDGGELGGSGVDVDANAQSGTDGDSGSGSDGQGSASEEEEHDPEFQPSWSQASFESAASEVSEAEDGAAAASVDYENALCQVDHVREWDMLPAAALAARATAAAAQGHHANTGRGGIHDRAVMLAALVAETSNCKAAATAAAALHEQSQRELAKQNHAYDLTLGRWMVSTGSEPRGDEALGVLLDMQYDALMAASAVEAQLRADRCLRDEAHGKARGAEDCTRFDLLCTARRNALDYTRRAAWESNRAAVVASDAVSSLSQQRHNKFRKVCEEFPCAHTQQEQAQPQPQTEEDDLTQTQGHTQGHTQTQTQAQTQAQARKGTWPGTQKKQKQLSLPECLSNAAKAEEESQESQTLYSDFEELWKVCSAQTRFTAVMFPHIMRVHDEHTRLRGGPPEVAGKSCFPSLVVLWGHGPAATASRCCCCCCCCR